MFLVLDQVVGRIQQAIARVDLARRDLREQAADSTGAWHALREQTSWGRPRFLTLVTATLLASIMVTAFLGKQAFAERPGDAIWARLSDAERRGLPAFISSGSLDAVMNCRVVGFRIEKDRCVPPSAVDEDAGWILPDETVARAAHHWSSEDQ